MNLTEADFIKITAPNAGLIGNDDQSESQSPHSMQTFSRIWKQVVDCAHENSVAVIENDEWEFELKSALVPAGGFDRIGYILHLEVPVRRKLLGVVPLLIASGAGAEARKVMGMTVFSGMLAATVIGVLVVPAMFVFVERYISKRESTGEAADS